MHLGGIAALGIVIPGRGEADEVNVLPNIGPSVVICTIIHSMASYFAAMSFGSSLPVFSAR